MARKLKKIRRRRVKRVRKSLRMRSKSRPRSKSRMRSRSRTRSRGRGMRKALGLVKRIAKQEAIKVQAALEPVFKEDLRYEGSSSGFLYINGFPNRTTERARYLRLLFFPFNGIVNNLQARVSQQITTDGVNPKRIKVIKLRQRLQVATENAYNNVDFFKCYKIIPTKKLQDNAVLWNEFVSVMVAQFVQVESTNFPTVFNYLQKMGFKESQYGTFDPNFYDYFKIVAKKSLMKRSLNVMPYGNKGATSEIVESKNNVKNFDYLYDVSNIQVNIHRLDDHDTTFWNTANNYNQFPKEMIYAFWFIVPYEIGTQIYTPADADRITHVFTTEQTELFWKYYNDRPFTQIGVKAELAARRYLRRHNQPAFK